VKDAFVAILLAASNLLDGVLKAAAQGLAAIVQNLDLPEGDVRWSKVGALVAEALRDMAAARDNDEDVQTAVRLAAERRVHTQLREMGLVDVG